MRSLTLVAAVAGSLLLRAALMSAEPLATVSGTVVGSDGPLAGAWVRVQATNNLTYSDESGNFALNGLTPDRLITITAWYTECKVGWVTLAPPMNGVEFTLRRYDGRDNPAYVWNTSYPDPANPSLGCGHCMSPSFPEWQRTAHAGSAISPRFLSVYNGVAITGTAVVSPGYKLDFPSTAGNCAACHAPGAAYDAPLGTDMNGVSGVSREGVFCEFCHKVGEVYLDPATGRPYDEAPGVLSLRLFRTYPGDALFFGSLDDVARRVSFLPLEKQSQFCAPCHQFSFGGTPIYQSFREWQESSYPGQGIECQTCHMPPGSSPTFVLPEKGGLERDPSRLASHKDLGLKDLAFMQSTLAMTPTTHMFTDMLEISVTLTNSGAGHHVPTDYPGRHLLLTVAAADDNGRPLAYLGDAVVPLWGGDEAGLPGKAFAKVLQDVVSGESPVVSYWKQTTVASDNRIAALASDTSVYRFALPQQGEAAQVTARLVLRRSFQRLMEEKGWHEADILMNETTLTIAPLSAHRQFLPVIVKP